MASHRAAGTRASGRVIQFKLIEVAAGGCRLHLADIFDSHYGYNQKNV